MTREQKRHERREGLLKAAIEVIRTSGQAASMDDIAAAAGVTKPILYRHFGDRRGLVHAIADTFAADLMSELGIALARSAEPREILAGTIDAYVAFVERDTELYRFIVRPSRIDKGELAGVAVAEFVPRISQMVAVTLGEQLRAAGADSGGAEPWAYGIVGMVHQAADWWVDRRPMSRAALVDYLVTLLWDGLDTTTSTSPATRGAS